jgi:hypothetical protein
VDKRVERYKGFGGLPMLDALDAQMEKLREIAGVVAWSESADASCFL